VNYSNFYFNLGPVGIVGSSTNELYVIGLSMTAASGIDDEDMSARKRIYAYPLRRPRSLLQGFVQSSARLLGFAWGSGGAETTQFSSSGIVKLIHVPRHRSLGSEMVSDGFLVTVSDAVLCLWQLGSSDGTDRRLAIDGAEGPEKFLWEVDMRGLLEGDLRRQVEGVVARGSPLQEGSKRFRTLDAMLLTSTTLGGGSDGRASVLFLSISASAVSGQSELWVHGVDLTLSGRAAPEDDDDDIDQDLYSIKLRRRVAICQQSIADMPAACRPRLIRGAMKDGSAVCVVWGDTSARARRCTLHTIELTDLRRYVGVGVTSGRSDEHSQGTRASKHGAHHPTANVQMTSGADDSEAYPHYLLLHDSATAAASRGQAGSHTSSSLCAGVGADTGIHCDAVVGVAAVHCTSGVDVSSNAGLSIVLKGLSSLISFA
jgi:hypothetical protein